MKTFENSCLIIFYLQHFIQVCFYFLGKKLGGHGPPRSLPLLRHCKFQLQRLQYVQNTAARVVCQGRKYDHITPMLQDFHWLPIHYRTVFKIILTVFKCLNTEAPEYLKRKLHYRQYSRSLRSVSNKLLKEPRSRTKTYGDRAFSNIAPRLWNGIPNDIRNITTFKL